MIPDSQFLNHIKKKFRIVVIDTEFQFDNSMNYIKTPICLVAKDLSTNQVYKIWDKDNKFPSMERVFDFENTLFVCHYSVAEVGYFLRKLMGRPPYIFDTWCEYAKLYKNIRPSLSLLAAATAYGYATPTASADKDYYRDLCIEKDTWTEEEKEGILKYCLDDVLMTEHIFYNLLDDLENHCGTNYEILLEQAMARGQSMACVAKAQYNGISFDTPLVEDFNSYWPYVKDAVIQRFNEKIGLWDSNSKFCYNKFEELIVSLGLFSEWPRTPKGKLKTNKETLELYDDSYNEIKLLKQINNLTNSGKLADYVMSEDGRYRPFGGFKMFGTHTGRCTPTSKWPYGAAKWSRNFMRPSFGSCYAYLDFKSEEPFVAAMLSGDKNLLEAYNSGDVYLHTAKLAGLAPAHATDKTHSDIRNIFKVIVLSSNYGAGAFSIAKKLKNFGKTYSETAGLIKTYKELYKVYFNWVDDRSNFALMNGYISSSLGWDRRFAKNAFINARSLMNWSIQAESAEILRNALIRLTDAGIKVCAMVHDAFLIECPIPEHKEQIRIAKQQMIDAAEYIVGGKIMVDEEIYFKNCVQLDKKGNPNKDQEIFDLIFEEINKFKNRKYSQVPTENMVKGITINY